MAEQHIDGVGDPKAVVGVVAGVDFSKIVLSAQEGFVLSRIDGHSSVETLCLATGLGQSTTIDIVRRLRSQGLVVVGNEEPLAEAGSGAIGAELVRASPSLKPAKQPELEDEPDCDLTAEVRMHVSSTYDALGDVNFFELLGVDPGADPKAIRRAYFKKSKKFHPDRYYTKRLGRYGEMLAEIFKQINAAYRFLEDPTQRETYRASIRSETEQKALERELERVAADALEEEEELRQQESAKSETVTGQYTYSRSRGFRLRERVARQMVRQLTRTRSESMEAAAQAARNSTLSSPTVGGRTTEGRAVATDRSSSGTTDHDRSTSERIDIGSAEFSSTDSKADSAGDKGAREARRGEDRARRRRRLSTMHPAAARKRRAQQFFEQGEREFAGGKILAAAASFNLALTFDADNTAYKRRYEEALDLSRDQTADGYYKRAMIEESVGRYEAAAKLFVRAADACQRDPYLQKAALAMLMTKDLKRAKEYAIKAAELEPRSADARVTLARVYLGAGLRKNARREVDYALKLSPGLAEAKELLKQIKRS